MLKSKKEILDEVGNMVGALYDERESVWRKYCKCSRDLKLTEEELADKNFRLEKIKNLIEEAFKEDELNVGNIYHSVYDDIYEIIRGANNE